MKKIIDWFREKEIHENKHFYAERMLFQGFFTYVLKKGYRHFIIYQHLIWNVRRKKIAIISFMYLLVMRFAFEKEKFCNSKM